MLLITMGLVVHEVDPSRTDNVTSAVQAVRSRSRMGMISAGTTAATHTDGTRWLSDRPQTAWVK
jgi:hypothetical protein